MKTSTAVILGVLGLAAVGGVAVGLAGSKKGPKTGPKVVDAERGYQVLENCKINVLDAELGLKWASSLGSDLPLNTALVTAFDGCGTKVVNPANLPHVRFLFNFFHALKSAAVNKGTMTKEQFNLEVSTALAQAKAAGFDTTGWPGELP